MTFKTKLSAKILSVVFVASLILSSFAPLSQLTVARAETSVWDGSTKAPTASGGAGLSADNPIKITSAEELAWLVNQTAGDTAGKFYKLTTNIQLNDTTAEGWQENAHQWLVVGHTASPISFAGTFDGDGHTISGLYVDSKLKWFNKDSGIWECCAGLFPQLSGNAVVKNIGIVNSEIGLDKPCQENGSSNNVGFITGKIAGEGLIQIQNCFADGTCLAKSNNIAAGLIGNGNGALAVTDCYSQAKLSGSSVGMIGDVWAPGKEHTVKNCYAVGYKVSRSDGAVVNNGAANFKYENCYTTAAVPEDIAGVASIEYDAMIGDEGRLITAVFGDRWTVGESSFPYLKIFETNGGYTAPTVEKTTDNGVKGRVWSGKLAREFAGGDGTASNPYQIETPEQLAWLTQHGDSTTAGKYYKLTADLILNDITKDNWKETAHQWFTDDSGTTFKGIFDGDGHIVSGMYVNLTEKPNDGKGYWNAYTGLFPVLGEGSAVKNVGIVGADINFMVPAGDASVAGLITGRVNADGVTITNCFADDTNTVKARNIAGGLVGNVGGSLTVTNSYSQAKLSGTTVGMIGDIWAPEKSITVKNCYAVGYRIARDDGYGGTYTIENCYTTAAVPGGISGVTKLDSDDMIDGNAATVMSGLDSSIWVFALNKRPYLKTFADNGYTAPRVEFTSNSGTEGEVWSGGTARGAAGGSGTEDDPFMIKTPEQLAWLVQQGEAKTAGKYYKLAADIRLNDTAADNWKENARQWFIAGNHPSTSFAGSLDGNGHIITGLYINNPDLPDGYGSAWEYNAGLFPRLSGNAAIKNLGIVNSEIVFDKVYKVDDEGKDNINNFAGLITGYAIKDGLVTLENCFADKTTSVKSSNVAGALVGYANSGMVINNCYSQAKLEGRTVGLIGDIYHGDDFTVKTKTVSNSYAIGYRVARDDETVLAFKFENCYTTVASTVSGCTKMVPDNMLGADGLNLMKLDTNIWAAGADSYPYLKIFGEDYAHDVERTSDQGVAGRVWSGKLAARYARGTGTKDDPYIIETPEQMALLVEDTETEGKFYKITEDLKLNDTTDKNWKENAPHQWKYCQTGGNPGGFAGTIDGGGHVVTGLYIKSEKAMGQYDNQYGGLFPALTRTAVVRGIGLDDSYIEMVDGLIGINRSGRYAGGIAGFIRNWDYFEEGADLENVTTISECFVGKNVTILSDRCAGILGGSGVPFKIKDCYFIGELSNTESVTYAGGILADTWTNPATKSGIIENCYVATVKGNRITGSRNRNVKFINTYTTIRDYEGVSSLTLYRMKGEMAKGYLNFDYDKVWKTVENGTPVLRVFKNGERYTNTDAPSKVKVEFVTNCDTEVEPIYGYDGEKLTFPNVTKYGYTLKAWHVFSDLSFEYNSDVFPMRDTILYAEWEPIGYMQDFEDYMYSYDGMGSDYEYYRPGSENYDVDYINSGIKAIHRLGSNTDEEDILLFGDELGYLDEGRKYEISFWVTTDQANADVTFSLVQHYFTDLEDDIVSCDKIERTALRKGEWTKVTYRFTAKGYYLRLRSSGGASFYLDDVLVVPLSGKGSILNGIPATGVIVSSLAALVAVTSLAVLLIVSKTRRAVCKK